MEWYKIALTHDQCSRRVNIDFEREFTELNAAAGAGADAVLFTELTVQGYTAYLSPASIAHCGELIARYSGVPCSEPVVTPELSFRSGSDEGAAWKLLS
jgi:hypothetical protein